jgi:Ca2+/Na+ antiporter
MSSDNHKCWLENLGILFKNRKMISYHLMSLGEKINFLTKLLILLSILLIVFKILTYNTIIIYFFSSLMIIILFYYKEKENMKKNQYIKLKENFQMSCNNDPPRITYNCQSKTTSDIDNKSSFRDKIIDSNKNNMKIDFNTLQFNKNFERKTDNQNLVGGPNPKTLVPPVIAAPLASLESWKNDGEYNISTLNVVKPSYEDESGYTITKSKCFGTSRVPPSYNCGSAVKIKSVKENFEFPFEKDDQQDLSFPNKGDKPINSLIGITEPVYSDENDDYDIIEPAENLNMSNTYDPRFYGYGTSYRGYVDKVVGQPRYYYDDVNAIKMPNYFTRNHIDMTPFGDIYGPDNHGGNKYHSNITSFADKHYLDSSLQFRTEMQNRLMQKINREQWQQKMFPIQRRGHRMMK